MINILYEDNHLLVVEKPINILVQKDKTNDLDLLSMLKNYLKEKYHKPGNVYLGLVHRLDRTVGGVMVFAKTSKCAARLSDQIKKHEFKKVYYAVVEGVLSNKKGRLENYLWKDERNNTSFVNNQGKLAILDYEVLKIKQNLSLIKIDLQTGRHHQIRVQFAHLGYPLYGDKKYNKNYKKGETISLFAKELIIKHPITKETIKFALELPNRYPYNIFR